MNEKTKPENLIFIIHKGSRKNKCNVCGKYFKEPGSLNIHKKIHTGDRPYKCKYPGCKKAFITMGNLRAHEDHHYGKKPYMCDYFGCNKRYSRQNRLLIHKRTHAGDKPYKCPFGGCDKSFNEKGNLKTHCRIHTGERPFECKSCGRAFKAHGHLKDHEKMHTNVKPYQCRLCLKSYGRSGILRNHMKTHERKSKVCCSLCKQVLLNKSALEEHMEKIHLKNNPSLINTGIGTVLQVQTTTSRENSQREAKEDLMVVDAEKETISVNCLSNDVTPRNLIKNCTTLNTNPTVNQFNLINVRQLSEQTYFQREIKSEHPLPLDLPLNRLSNLNGNHINSVNSAGSSTPTSAPIQNNLIFTPTNSIPITPVANIRNLNMHYKSTLMSSANTSGAQTPMNNPFHLLGNVNTSDLDVTPRTFFEDQRHNEHYEDFQTSLNKNLNKNPDVISVLKDFFEKKNKDTKYTMKDIMAVINADRASWNEKAVVNGIQHTPSLNFDFYSPGFTFNNLNHPGNLIDSSPGNVQANNLSVFSPIFYNQRFGNTLLNFNNSNGNTTRNVDVFSVPRNTNNSSNKPNPSFSSYAMEYTKY